MKIKILNHEGKIFHKPTESNPWHSFFKEFEKNGLDITSSKLDFKYDILVCNGYIPRIQMFLIRTFIKPKFIFLILWEPFQSKPQIYRQKFLNHFNFIFSPSPEWISGKNTQIFNWPQGTDVTPVQTFNDWRIRKNKVVCVNANKFSIIKGELYSLRRKILSNPIIAKEIDLFGRNWGRSYLWSFFQIIKSLIKSNPTAISCQGIKLLNPNLQSYRGSIPSKPEVISNYRVSLVIENSSNYLSEKLFDALASQTIAIYVGIDLTNVGLNKDIAIQLDHNIDIIIEEISRIIRLTDREQYSIFMKQQTEFRDVLKQWNNKTVFSKLARDIYRLIIVEN